MNTPSGLAAIQCLSHSKPVLESRTRVFGTARPDFSGKTFSASTRTMRIESPLHDELVIHSLADGEVVLANLLEPVSLIETLRAVVLRPDTDIQRHIALAFEPLERGPHEPPTDAQVVKLRQHVELLHLTRCGFQSAYW